VKTAELRELARSYSIQVSYEDAAGKRREASRESILEIVKRRAAPKKHFVEPVSVAWGRKRPVVELRLPQTRDSIEYELILESGETSSGRAAVENNAFFTLPQSLPVGYHTIRVDGHEAMIFAAPSRAPKPRGKTWGIFAPLYAAHSRRSWGAGDLGDLQSYREWVESLGGSVVATLPMLAAMNDEPSPYSPSSRLFWNEMYLDVTRLPEFREDDVDAADIQRLQETKRVDYDAVRDLKERVLRRCAARFQKDADFDAFAEKARAYAEFMSDVDYHLYVQYRLAQQMREFKRLYLDFPLGVNPNGFDVHQYGDHFAKRVSVGSPPDMFFTKGQNWGFPPFDPDAIREHHHDYFRACVRHHMQHAGILRMDHVMGLHRLFWIPEGAEAKDGVYVRYPADELYAVLLIEASRTNTVIVGEDLGTVPVYVPRAMKRRGLRRMYVVQYEIKPEGDEPAGTPQPASVASINTHDMPTFAGFWDGKDIDDRVEQDLLDERGAAEERDKREQMRQALTSFLKARGLLSSSSGNTFAVLKALLDFLSESEAEVVLVNLEDLWLETEPQNVPGVPDRSWRQKLRYCLEDLQDDATITGVLRDVDERRRKSNGQ
jgi:4-alpha-glucanotransferase